MKNSQFNFRTKKVQKKNIFLTPKCQKDTTRAQNCLINICLQWVNGSWSRFVGSFDTRIFTQHINSGMNGNNRFPVNNLDLPILIYLQSTRTYVLQGLRHLKQRVPITSKSANLKGPFIHYVTTFLGFLDPPPPIRNHVFSTENNQKLIT